MTVAVVGLVGDDIGVDGVPEDAGVFLSGISGMGKTTLVEHFLGRDLTRDPIVLRGNCYERESVPFKAFDGVIDRLALVLGTFETEQLATLLPDDISVLGRLFPVLDRVRYIRQMRQPSEKSIDRMALRSRAFTALKMLLDGLSQLRPLVLFIDDLQWADEESLDLLGDLTQPPAPSAFLIVSYRLDAGQANEHFKAFLETALERSGNTHVGIGPLSEDETSALVRYLLADTFSDEFSDTIWEQTSGDPFLVTETCRYLAESGRDMRDVDSWRVQLGEVLRSRVEKLPRRARRLIEVVALASVPTPDYILTRALGLDERRSREAVAYLKRAKLVRSIHQSEFLLDVSHDRIRTVVCDTLDSSTTKTLHRQLAEALESWEDAPLEARAGHWHLAGNLEKAQDYALQAAESALSKFAFHNAAAAYRLAIKRTPEEGPQRQQLHRLMADCLAKAGRNADAAEAYSSALSGPEVEDELALRALAASQLLSCGQFARGLEAGAAVLRDIGITWPRSERHCIALILLHSLKLRLRGLGWTERREKYVEPEMLKRLDALWGITVSLTMSAPIFSSYLAVRFLRLALEVGEPARIARALTYRGGLLSFLGGRSRDRATKFLDAAMDVVDRLEMPDIFALKHTIAGADAYYRGRWASALTQPDRVAMMMSLGLGLELRSRRDQAPRQPTASLQAVVSDTDSKPAVGAANEDEDDGLRLRIESFEQRLAVADQDVSVLLEYGDFLARHQRYNQALATLGRALSLAPSSPGIRARVVAVCDASETADVDGAAPSTSRSIDSGDVVRIPAGEFTMGSLSSEDSSLSFERPAHHVTITRDFWLQKCPVTQAEWQAVFGNNPSRFSSGPHAAPRPVETISWFDAIAYANALSLRDGLAPCYLLEGEKGTPGLGDFTCERVVFLGLDSPGYRLPTEAEWEYAARAGTKTPRYGPPSLIAWYRANAHRTTHPVGQLDHNAWGLFDMLGNVCEWVWDRAAPYEAGRARDPLGPPAGPFRIRRSGSFYGHARGIRAPFRIADEPHVRIDTVGVRLVTPPPLDAEHTTGEGVPTATLEKLVSNLSAEKRTHVLELVQDLVGLTHPGYHSKSG